MLKNKTAIITGASFGIGAATAHAFAKAGARVIIAARTKYKLEVLQKQLQEQYQADVCVLAMDVCDRQAVATAIDGLAHNWQGIDILVNNAGLALGLDPIAQADPDDWDRMIDTNVKGLLYVSHYVLKGMIKRNQGHVINIGSVSSYEVYPGGSVYCATKFAVRAISQGMKMEVTGTPIRVTEIDPGMAETEFSVTRFKGDRERAHNVYANIQALSGADVADAIVYAVNCPAHVNIRNLVIVPTDQGSVLAAHKK